MNINKYSVPSFGIVLPYVAKKNSIYLFILSSEQYKPKA